MAKTKDTSKKNSKSAGESTDASYKGIVRVTDKVQTKYTVLEKRRAEEPSPNTEPRSGFKRVFTIMQPQRKKKGPPPSIGSMYV